MHISRLLCSLALLTSVLAASALATDYYVHPDGSDNNDGLSEQTPLQSLTRVNSITLEAGDAIYLAANETHMGSLELRWEDGTAEQPIVVSSYGGEQTDRAKIDAAGYLAGISMLNVRHINISNIEIIANAGAQHKNRLGQWMRLGVLIDVNHHNAVNPYGYISMDNLFIHDIYHEEFGFDRGNDNNTPNGTQNYGWGVRLFNNNNGTTKLTNISLSNSEIADVAHTAFKITSNSNRDIEQRRWGNVYQVSLTDNYIHDIGGPGIQFGGTNSGYVGHNKVHRTGSGSDSRKWNRGSGMWPWGSKNLLIEFNEFTDAQGPADSAGFHIDFNCSNVIVQHNLSKNNAGGFIEILGNNENNSYRYNVSINDGYRKKGVDGASHDGKILWLSGYVGKNNPQVAPKNNYLYNNTIYTKPEILAQFAVHNETDGLVVANNIFYIEGASRHIDQNIYNLVDGENPTQDIKVTNNLFLSTDNWPDTLLAQSSDAIIGEPSFSNKGGNSALDYVPTNSELIANKGVDIEAIADDPIGLVDGFNVETDILGNVLDGNQHIGAISPFKTTHPSAVISSILAEQTFQTRILLTVTFDTKVTGLELTDFVGSNATLTQLSKLDEMTWQLEISPLQYGLVSISLLADSVTDNQDIGNQGAEFSIIYQQIADDSDTKAPVASFSGPVEHTLYDADIAMAIEFDEAIAGFDGSDLQSVNASINNLFQESDLLWRFDLVASDYGEVSVTLPADSVYDVAGNYNAEVQFSVTYQQQSQSQVPAQKDSGGSGGSVFFLLWFGLLMHFIKRLGMS
ncbi:right-handed parallel beta-helix repeat-containing protein [Thalassotalea sp. HSM 43]|uniref:Ig-like domain-containing protein n=1 Tax=Thalassotalea sp. HSM 43 TaxID=2552945 RepID=UPI001080FA5A|nr:Ig-like domain-containing protein [Thalassotalea sp. HSM 43]QBY04225.1 right-handed parallel beta-helix repeat-containing protein [Thalassotalea sp. HSM 43]